MATTEKSTERLTWESITQIEPQLVMLESIVARADVPTDTAQNYWRRWVVFKRLMRRLVGWLALEPALRSADAYGVAHDHLLGRYQGRAAELCEQGGSL